MGVRNIVGFETGDSYELDDLVGYSSIQSTKKRTGNYALEVYSFAGSGADYATITAVKTPPYWNHEFDSHNLYTRTYIQLENTPSGTAIGEEFQRVETAADGGIALRLEASGSEGGYVSVWKLNEDGSSTHLADVLGQVLYAYPNWYRVDIGLQGEDIGDGTTWQVVVYDQWESRYSSAFGTDDFLSGSTFSRVILGKKVNRNNHAMHMRYDDFAVSDGNWLKRGKIAVLLPSGDGYYKDWLFTWPQVDEIPINTTDFVVWNCPSTGVSETENLFDFPAGADVDARVNYIKSCNVTKASGALHGFYTLTRHNSVDATDGEITASYDWDLYAAIYEKRIDNNTAWTLSSLVNLESGVRAVNHTPACSGSLYCTWTGVMVDYDNY